MNPVRAVPGEKPIEKKILHAGRGGKVEFRNGTKVKFHFVTKLGEQVLDDSRKWDNAMELIIGKKFKMEAWEWCVQTMRLCEVASFTLKPIHASPYPSVAKTLRDAFNKDENGKVKPKKEPRHVCGMMAMGMEGGLMGYEDLNELAKEPKGLEFIIELISVDQPDSYVKESWQMDYEEKLCSVTKLRVEGNALYSENNFKEASEKYADALGRLEQLLLREKPQDEEWLALRKQKVPLLLNYSQCKLAVEDFYPAIEQCTEVLEIEPDNVKAVFRRGKAHKGAWNPSEARKDFKRVCELDTRLKKVCHKELKNIDTLEKCKDQQDRERLKHLF